MVPATTRPPSVAATGTSASAAPENSSRQAWLSITSSAARSIAAVSSAGHSGALRASQRRPAASRCAGGNFGQPFEQLVDQHAALAPHRVRRRAATADRARCPRRAMTAPAAWAGAARRAAARVSQGGRTGSSGSSSLPGAAGAGRSGSPHSLPAAPDRIIDRAPLAHRFGKPGIPASRRRHAAIARAQRAADEQRFLGPGHGDVEQPPVLLAALAGGLFARFGNAADLFPAAQLGQGHRAGIGRARIGQVERFLAGVVRIGGGVGEDDDRGLQALGAVHGHHPHQPLGIVRLALQLALAGIEPGEEARRGWRSRRWHRRARH